MKKQHWFLAFIGILFFGCATSASDIHAWGGKGDYDRIRTELHKNPQEDIRIAAAIELGKGNYSWGISDLVILSRDPIPAVRLAAIDALGHYAGAEVYGAIIQATGDENENVGRTAESILSTWQSETIDFLIEALQNRNYKVRLSSVKVLGKLKDSHIGPALIDRAVHDEHSSVRREAAKMLGSMGYAQAKQALFKLKNKDQSKEVSLEAEAAISKIGGTIFPFKLAVLSFVSQNEQVSVLAKKAADSFREALVSSNICGVMPASGGVSLNFSDDISAKAAALGKDINADQVIYGVMEKDANKIKVKAYRIEVSSGRLLQQEQLEGYIEDAEKTIENTAKQLVSRFE